MGLKNYHSKTLLNTDYEQFIKLTKNPKRSRRFNGFFRR